MRQPRERLDARRQLQLSKHRRPRGKGPDARRRPAAFPVEIDAEPDAARTPDRRISLARRPVLCCCVRRQHGKDRLFDVVTIQRAFVEAADDAVDADRRGDTGHQIEIAAGKCVQTVEPVFQPAGITVPRRQCRVKLTDQLIK